MSDLTSVVLLLAGFNILGVIVFIWLFRNLRRSHIAWGVAFVLAFGAVELIAAVYFFQQGEIRWAVEAGLVGLVAPIVSLAILNFTTTHSA